MTENAPRSADSASPEEGWPFGPYGTVVGDWIDAISHLRCVVIVGPAGALNGYVQVPPEHPMYRRGYSECLADCCDCCWEHTLEAQVSVHGGITFDGNGIDFMAEDEWWFGFDCAHSGDLIPSIVSRIGRFHDDDILRGPEWVGAEATRLAHQLAHFDGYRSPSDGDNGT